MARRDRDPESSLGEPEAGRPWLLRLVVATWFVFGLKRGVGAETRSAFVGHLPLEGRVGCAPSAWRGGMHTLARLRLDTAAAWEQDGIAHGEIRPVIGAVDETFLQRMLLVCMDVATGYGWRAAVATARSFDPWYDRATPRLTTCGTAVLSRGSDRAKALSTLAHTGLGCPRIPDLLHLGHDLAQGDALGIFGRLRQATRDLDHAQQRLETVQTHAQGDQPHVEHAQARGVACPTAVTHWQGGSRVWRQPLSNGSCLLHPWRLVDATRQTSQAVEEPWRAEREAIATLLEINGLPRQHDTVDTVRKPRAGIAALVDLWWQTVRHDFTQRAMTPSWTPWAEDVLRPLMDWHAQRHRTRHPGQKAPIARVFQTVEAAFARHACPRKRTPEWLAGWKAWAAEHTKAFQRVSAAVEGRHGSLSQMQHNQRGLPRRRSQVWTAWPNFDCRAANGTTPASRFFRRSFPELFEHVLSQIDELPLPRQRRQALAATY